MSTLARQPCATRSRVAVVTGGSSGIGASRRNARYAAQAGPGADVGFANQFTAFVHSKLAQNAKLVRDMSIKAE